MSYLKNIKLDNGLRYLQAKDKKIINCKIANEIIDKIIANPHIKLGLATGSSPEGIYQNLVKITNKKQVDWSNVITFNLDEYLNIDIKHKMSYHSFMKKHLFDLVNLKKENTFFPNKDNSYEKMIEAKGGIDYMILGIGTNGHIAFNEPGSKSNSKTREVNLTQNTIKINARFFNSIELVPKKAITMGLNTILQSKEIILIAFGVSKEKPVELLLKSNSFNIDFPASILVKHQNVRIFTDLLK